MIDTTRFVAFSCEESFIIVFFLKKIYTIYNKYTHGGEYENYSIDDSARGIRKDKECHEHGCNTEYAFEKCRKVEWFCF